MPAVALVVASVAAGCSTLPVAAPTSRPLTSLITPVAPDRTPADGSPGAPSPAPPGPPLPSRFRSGDHGYDISYPQCVTGDHPPAGAQFAIVGINAGRAFTVNPCLARQVRESAGMPRAVYVNSGYNPNNAARVGRGCRAVADELAADGDLKVAYAIGCEEAAYAINAFRRAGGFQPIAWWIDVESSNSWDEKDLNLNRFALEGLIDRLGLEGPPIGVYSTFKEWRQLTGAWRPAKVAANWVAGPSIAAACSAPGFTGAAVWLAQEANGTWDEGLDSDWAC